jgi:hypothetical protein
MVDPSEAPLVSGAVSSAFTQLIAGTAATSTPSVRSPESAAQSDPQQIGHETDLVIRAYSLL